MTSSMEALRRSSVAVVAVHALITAIHAMSHSRLSILMSPWQNAYIFLVIVAAPVIAGILIWRGTRVGFQLLAVSMLGSLLFGGYYHFIASGPDNVASLMDHTWSFPFQITAALLAVTEAAGFVIGLLGARKQSA